MDQDLLQRCGLKPLLPFPSPTIWLRATLNFIGPQHYVLSTKHCDICLHTREQGFGLMFRNPVQIAATALLGKHNLSACLYDVEIHFQGNMPVFSLASMMPGRYPCVLRRGEVLDVS